MNKPRRPTDTERLDWLDKRWPIMRDIAVSLIHFDDHDNVRDAIDAAMREEESKQ